MILNPLLWVRVVKIFSYHQAIRKLIPYSFECKNQEKLNIWSSLEQNRRKEEVNLYWCLKEIEVKPVLQMIL